MTPSPSPAWSSRGPGHSDVGQTFIFHGHRFQIMRRQRNQITALRVWPKLEEEAPDAKGG